MYPQFMFDLISRSDSGRFPQVGSPRVSEIGRASLASGEGFIYELPSNVDHRFDLRYILDFVFSN